VGALQDVPLRLLAAVFGSGAYALKQLAFGRGLSSVSSTAQLPKSVGREVTFSEDTSDSALLRATLLSLADDTVAQLRTQGLAARTITLKVRYSTFHTITRQATFARAVSSPRAIYGVVACLFGQIDLGARWVRLVGISASSLCGNACQLTFDDQWKEVALAEAVDRVRAKYGKRALRPATCALLPVARTSMC